MLGTQQTLGPHQVPLHVPSPCLKEVLVGVELDVALGGPVGGRPLLILLVVNLSDVLYPWDFSGLLIHSLTFTEKTTISITKAVLEMVVLTEEEETEEEVVIETEEEDLVISKEIFNVTL